MSADLIDVIIIAIASSALVVSLTILMNSERNEMINRFNQLEDSIREQLDLSKRTFDASSRMIGEALRLANQKQGYADAYEEYWGEDEN